MYNINTYMIIQESKSQNTNYLGLTSRGLFLGRNGQKPGQSDKEEPSLRNFFLVMSVQKSESKLQC